MFFRNDNLGALNYYVPRLALNLVRGFVFHSKEMTALPAPALDFASCALAELSALSSLCSVEGFFTALPANEAFVVGMLGFLNKWRLNAQTEDLTVRYIHVSLILRGLANIFGAAAMPPDVLKGHGEQEGDDSTSSILMFWINHFSELYANAKSSGLSVDICNTRFLYLHDLCRVSGDDLIFCI